MARLLVVLIAWILLLIGNAEATLRKFKWTVTRGITTLDGQEKLSWLVNGQSPGPLLTATLGEHVEVCVLNRANESITIHFHGVEQLGTPWSDGVPGLTQYPIQPGKEFVYKFKVTQTGSYWYHSHSHHQLTDGLRGPIFFKPNQPSQSSINALGLAGKQLEKALHAELHPFQFLVYDNFHASASHTTEQWETTKVESLCVDNILVNGKGRVICPDIAEIQPKLPPIIGNITARGCINPGHPLINAYGGDVSLVDPDLWFNCNPTEAPLEVFRVSSSDEYAVFNLINVGSTFELKVSIDSHSLWVFAVDGAYVKPVQGNTLLIPVGERVQFLVKLDQPEDDYAIRIASAALPQSVSGYSVLSYKKGGQSAAQIPPAKKAYIDYTGLPLEGSVLVDHQQFHPWPQQAPPTGEADVTLRISLVRSDAVTWEANGAALKQLPDDFEPLLFNPANVARLDPAMYRFIQNGSVVDIIFEVEVVGTPPAQGIHPPHPMHKHSNKAFFLGAGVGKFPAETAWKAWVNRTEGLNLEDPPVRDSFNTLATQEGSSWAAIRYQVTNPAPTLLHCHLDPHMSSGMAFILLEGLESLGPIPSQYLPSKSHGAPGRGYSFF